MAEFAYPVLFAVFIWWFSTGAIIYLDNLPRHTFRWSLLGATVLLTGALYGLAVSSTDTTVAGAYVAFTAGLVIWGWHEVSFLMGFVTGPRTAPCPPDSTGWCRVGHAILTILYHELAILVTLLAVVALTWGAPNQIGAWTFVILWLMRLSAKLNVFLGVPNLSDDFLPEHLQYLKTYFRRASMNLLFPICISASTGAVALLIHAATASTAGPFEVTGLTLLAALLALAILEHWFLVLPLPDAALWAWWLRAREPRRFPPRRTRADPCALTPPPNEPWRRRWTTRRTSISSLLTSVRRGATECLPILNATPATSPTPPITRGRARRR